jgi:hypothetical protein
MPVLVEYDTKKHVKIFARAFLLRTVYGRNVYRDRYKLMVTLVLKKGKVHSILKTGVAFRQVSFHHLKKRHF